MPDYLDNHGLMSRLRARSTTGTRITRAAKGSYASQQRLTKDLLRLCAATPNLAELTQQAGLARTRRASLEDSTADRILRMSQEDIERTAELVARGECLPALCFVFGTAKQRLEQVDVEQDLEIAS